MNFKDNLKQLRNKREPTQKDLSNKINFSLATIQDWEQGRTEPKFKTLEQLTQVLECDYNDLLK